MDDKYNMIKTGQTGEYIETVLKYFQKLMNQQKIFNPGFFFLLDNIESLALKLSNILQVAKIKANHLYYKDVKSLSESQILRF